MQFRRGRFPLQAPSIPDTGPSVTLTGLRFPLRGPFLIAWWTLRIFFIFFLFLGGGKGGGVRGGGRGGGPVFIKIEGGGGGYPRRRRGRGKGAGGVSVERGAKYFFSGPKCPPRAPLFNCQIAGHSPGFNCMGPRIPLRF